MRIATETTTHENGTDRDLDAAFERLQRETGGFVRVERAGGGGDLQTLKMPLEYLKDGRIYRPSTIPGVTALFRAFAAGAPDWDQGIEWIDVTGEIQRERRNARLALLGWIALIVGAAVLWWVTRR